MLSQRLSNMIPSYTIGISSKVSKLKSEGIKVLDLSIGDPDFKVPQKAIDYGINSLENNITKYDLVNGLKILREEISKKLLKENNIKYNPDEIVVSSGAKNCITNAFLALTNTYDEVLIPSPYWVSYIETVKLLNCIPVVVNTLKENNFKVTVSDLEKYKTEKTKILLLNNPSNPTGVIYTKEELLEIVDFCYKNNIYIISDEIYERICFDTEFISIASLSEKAKEITITINGFSKSVAMTGLRVGYTASNKKIADAIKNIQGHLISHPSVTSQYVAYGALKECENEIDEMVKIYKKRRDIACNLLNNIKDISYIYPNGAFYVFVDLSNIKEKIKYEESFSIEFCNLILEKENIALVPGIAFGMDDFVRISFACSEDTLTNGILKIKSFISNL